MVGDIDRHDHRSCARSTHVSGRGGQPNLAAGQQSDGVTSLSELAYDGPADPTTRASHSDHAPAHFIIAHA